MPKPNHKPNGAPKWAMLQTRIPRELKEELRVAGARRDPPGLRQVVIDALRAFLRPEVKP